MESRRNYVSIYLNTQPVSVDESYLEFPPGSDGLACAANLRRRIMEETGCPASAGIGNNMLLARSFHTLIIYDSYVCLKLLFFLLRLATKKAKPNGQFQMPSDILNYMRHMPLRELPGIGHAIQEKLTEKGVITCEDVWKHSKATLQSWFGEGKGVWLHALSRGEDDTELVPVTERYRILYY